MANNLVVCGGTFDHFHKGHETFLNYALSLDGRLIIGLTSDEYVRSSKFKVQSSKSIEDYKIREKSVKEFLAKKKVQDRIEIVKIDDLFGPTLSKDITIDAIVVSQDTKKGAEIINRKRKELGLKDLKILVAPFVYAQDRGLISSARIRNGEINRAGRLYIKPEWLKTDLALPEDLRKNLKKPFGVLDFNVLKHQNQSSWVVSVGDVTTRKLNELSADQKISVVDFKVARKKVFDSFADLGFSGDEEITIASNSPGQITHDLFSKVLNIFKSVSKKRIILKIEGEEDLAVLPLILAAPLNTIIYYGQPNMGLVRILVSEEKKEQVYNLVSKFKPI